MAKEIKKETLEKENEKVKESSEKKQQAIVTSRVLFISVLDKIFLVILGLCFLGGTVFILRGPIASLEYGFFRRIGLEIIFLLFIFVFYLFLNWLYNCAVKTILCLTKKEVYKETYFPFKRSEESIPLTKITKVSTLNLFWIFRAIIIHQYHSFPLIFWTWNNQEFKDKLTELITNDNEKILNEYEEKNLLNESMYKYISYILFGLASLICIIGIIKFVFFIFGTERKLVGSYSYQDNVITLNRDGTCEIIELVDNVKECHWHYDKSNKNVLLEYEYESGYFYTYTENDTLKLNYDKKNKTLEYKSLIFKK